MSRASIPSFRALGAFCLALAAVSTTALTLSIGASDAEVEEDLRVGDAPRILYSRLSPSEFPDPIWVSADQVVNERGEMDWDALGASEAEDWRRTEHLRRTEPGVEVQKGTKIDGKGLIRRVSESECPSQQVYSWPSPVRRSEDRLPSLVEGAKAAFAGTVVERTPGFLIGRVATILTVEVTETFGAGAPEPNASSLYVAYPQGRFRVAGKVYCGGHRKGPDAPEVGSSVLVLAQHAAIDEQGMLFQVSMDEIASRGPDGDLVLPQTLKGDEATGEPVSWKELIESVRRAFVDRQAPGREPSDDSAGEEGS